MAYNKDIPITANSFNVDIPAVGIWGVGYGSVGYGQTTPAALQGSVVRAIDFATLRTAIANIVSWQGGTISSLIPPATKFATGLIAEAHTTAAPANDVYDIIAGSTELVSTRFNYVLSNMTATTSAATTSRSTVWGSGATGITAEFMVTFASSDAARFFFNTGGELRISLNHPSSASPLNASWRTTLLNFVCALRAQTTVRTGGSYGVAQNIGWYGLTTTYQTIIDGTNSTVAPYTTNDFLVEARVANIIDEPNGGNGTQVYFRVTLMDEQTLNNNSVASGTSATLGHLRATGSILPNKMVSPTCTVVKTFNA